MEVCCGIAQTQGLFFSIVSGWEITPRQWMLLTTALNAFVSGLRGQWWSSGLVRGGWMEVGTLPRPEHWKLEGLCAGRTAAFRFILRGGVATEVPR